METSIIISGFGGQGALFAGQILAYGAMEAGLEVTWIPSYGPEMRGGTAHCTVVLADEPVGSPLVRNPDHVIAMSLPAADKYEMLVKPGGYLVVDSTLITRGTKRSDIKLIVLPATTIATQLGDVRLVNMVMLGALMAATGLMPVAVLENALRAHLPAHNRHLLDANIAALQQGAEMITRLGEKET